MSFLEHLNEAQRAAVQATNGPVMIVAGAGSGKTRVLTYRAAYLIHQGIRPESILALTFTNKAAEEMKSRITALVGPSSRALWMGTFHSLFARLLRKECEHLGYGRNFSIYDTDDSLAALKSVYGALGLSPQQVSPQAVRARISRAKNLMIPPSKSGDMGHDSVGRYLPRLYEEYDRRLAHANALDFDDLLLKPLEIFSRFPDVLQRYQYRFSHILVDEYQDTNRVQYALLRALASLHRNICVVGDDAQSIYAFRGADIRNILDFEKDYPNCTTFRLEQNYRSTQRILDAAHSIIRHNQDQIPKKLWTQNVEGELVVLDTCVDERDEAQRVVTRIEEETRKHKRSLNDFTVLYRTNAQSRSLEDALRRNGIPYLLVGGVAFYRRKEIKDVLAYLRVLTNPRDDESLLRIINEPARSIGDTTVQRVKNLAAKLRMSLYETLASPQLSGLLSERAIRAVSGFHALIAKYITLKTTMSVNELARTLVDEVGFLRLLKEENTPESLARRDNIQELISALSEYNTEHPEARLEDFLEEVSLIADIDMAEFGRNAVTLMTLHAAKGLEFPVVFITGLEEGLFPIAHSTGDRQELEEERRLLYVGMTRAEEKLYLCHAQRRFRMGESTFSVRSRFLDEMDDSLLESPPSQPGRDRFVVREDSAVPPRRKKHSGETHARRAQESHHFASDPMPAYEEESQVHLSVRVGLRVRHETFGSGRIVAVSGQGDDARAVVDFERVGRKQLVLKYAHLHCE